MPLPGPYRISPFPMNRVLLLLLACVLSASGARAATLPSRVQIDVVVTSGGMHLGEGRDVLQHDGKQYTVRSESRTAGVAAIFYKMNIRREARGLITKNGLRPLHFEETRSGKPRRAADFDWDAHTVKLTDGDEVDTEPLTDNTFDQTSFTYAFAFRPPSGDSMAVKLTDGRRLSDYRYRMVGRERLSTPMGELETLHFQKVKEGDDKRGFEVWLAVEHHNLPVQIRYVEKNGMVVDSTVTGITYQ
jgi:hypothetical protein